MNLLIRWGKFSLVGAMGMFVQVASLALFLRWDAAHYLFASAAAVELTLLHNFAWHVHYTWRDRADESSRLRQLVRFHLSNGLVSMMGNLALMRLLVRETHLPLLLSNVVAILCCSVANFYLGNSWAFARGSRDGVSRPAVALGRIYRPGLTLAFLVLLMNGTRTKAQAVDTSPADNTVRSSQVNAGDLPQAPAPRQTPATTYHATPNDSYLYHVGAFCGIGASTSTAATKPTVGCGAGLTILPLPVFLEVGVMAPQANRSYLSGYLSLDSSIPLARSSTRYLPLAIVGYSRLFETGHAFDYGLALALPHFGKQKDNGKSLRIELRDYWTFASPAQHNVMLRVGWMAEEAD